MRTTFTNEDVRNLIDKIFNGNLWSHKLKAQPYENPNSENLLLIDNNTGEKKEIDIAEYLNIKFYTWKNRLVEKGDGLDEQPLSPLETWVASLNFSMNEAYALIETIDEEVVASQDIDSATKTCKISFIVQTNKIKNLDYYVSKLRNIYLGNPQTIQNSYGDNIKAYIMVGALLYDQEPITMQLGECVLVSCNFRLSYLNDALTYNDTKVEISLDGDDIYNSVGEIVDEYGFPTKTKYMEMPIIKQTWQNIFASTAVPTAQRPDLTGFLATSLSTVKTLSFYDFNKELTMRFNDLFWRCGCYRYDGMFENKKDINIPIFLKITTNGHSYVYKDMIDNMEKTLTNNDFNISSITLKGWGKLETEFTIIPSIRVVINPNYGTGPSQEFVVYEGQNFEIPLELEKRQGYYFYGVQSHAEPPPSSIMVVYPVGFEMTFSKLQSLYKSYGDGNGTLTLYASWREGTIPQCTVTIDNRIQITKTNKSIINNGDGTYNMELYTRLDVEPPEGYTINGDGIGNFATGSGIGGSPKDVKYVIIYDEIASISLEAQT